MNDLVRFDFQGKGIRTVTIDGEPWFVAKDVCEILGYVDTNKAISTHCKGVAKYHPLETAGGVQNFRLIREPDLYRLVAHSQLPAAEKFETWVYDEVLPEIRKTGMYIPTPKDYIEALEALLKSEKEKQRLKEENNDLRILIGDAEHWKQAKAIKWVKEYFKQPLTNTFWSQFGKALSQVSRRMGEEIRKAEDTTWGIVNVYSDVTIDKMESLLKEHSDLLKRYRL